MKKIQNLFRKSYLETNNILNAMYISYPPKLNVVGDYVKGNEDEVTKVIEENENFLMNEEWQEFHYSGHDDDFVFPSFEEFEKKMETTFQSDNDLMDTSNCELKIVNDAAIFVKTSVDSGIESQEQKENSTRADFKIPKNVAKSTPKQVYCSFSVESLHSYKKRITYDRKNANNPKRMMFEELDEFFKTKVTCIMANDAYISIGTMDTICPFNKQWHKQPAEPNHKSNHRYYYIYCDYKHKYFLINCLDNLCKYHSSKVCIRPYYPAIITSSIESIINHYYKKYNKDILKM